MEGRISATLLVIAKDERSKVENLIKLYSDLFNELVFVVDDIKAFNGIKKSSNVKFVEYELSVPEKEFGGIFFDRKRNFAETCISNEYYVRIDTDDEIVNVEGLKNVVDKAIANNIDVVYCYYNYSRDDYGNVHAGHNREFLVKVSKDFEWKKIIHENISFNEGYEYRTVLDKGIKIEHITGDTHSADSALRNIRYLLFEYNNDVKNGREPDARTLSYLGKMFLNVNELDKSQSFFEKHIGLSGWDEDKYTSWIMLAEIAMRRKDYKDAVACCYEAISEIEDKPDAYFKIHEIYFEQQEWNKAIHWGKIGFAQPVKDTFQCSDPSGLTWRPALSMAHCLASTEQHEEALKFLEIAKKFAPDFEYIKNNEHIFHANLMKDKYLNNFMWMLQYLKEHDSSKIEALTLSVPEHLWADGCLSNIRHQVAKPIHYDDKSIAIFCGKTADIWGPPSVIDGVGGSEEAVIYMSNELTRLGYNVTVFCNCGYMAGNYKDVSYKSYADFNPNDKYNIVISWRTNMFKHVGVTAKKKIVWLHDKVVDSQFDDDSTFDKIIVLSQYHKSLLPKSISEDKIFVSTNGLNKEDFRKLKNVKKDKNKVIYASSYDRGLEELLDIWGDVIKECPDAQLHIYYGWNTYDSYVKKGLRSPEYKEMMVAKMNQPGIFEHGRIGHRKLLKKYAESQVFAYPTNFSGEINCIALTKAKATGCLCVTNDKYVLGERNDEYVAGDMGKFTDMLVGVLKSDITNTNDLDKYIDDNSWETVAKNWKAGLLDA